MNGSTIEAMYRRQALDAAVQWSRRRKVGFVTVLAVARHFERYLRGDREEAIAARRDLGASERPVSHAEREEMFDLAQKLGKRLYPEEEP